MSIPTPEIARRLYDAFRHVTVRTSIMSGEEMTVWCAVAEAARDGMRTSAQALCEAQAEIDSLRARAEACHDALVAEKNAHAQTRAALATAEQQIAIRDEDAELAVGRAECPNGWPEGWSPTINGKTRWRASPWWEVPDTEAGRYAAHHIAGWRPSLAADGSAFASLAAAWKTAEQAISRTASESAAVHARSTALFARLTKAEQEAADQRDRLTGLERDTTAFSEANQRQRAIIEHLRSKLINVSNADLDREIAWLAKGPTPHAAERADAPTSPGSPRPVVP